MEDDNIAVSLCIPIIIARLSAILIIRLDRHTDAPDIAFTIH